MVTIKNWLCLASVFIFTTTSHAATQSLTYDGFGKPITSSQSGGKTYLDVSASLTESAVAAPGAAQPAVDKIVGGVDIGTGLAHPLSVSATGVLNASTTLPPNANASLVQSLVVGNGAAVSFSAPANAVGYIAQASSSNSQNLRCSSGTTATTTLGIRLEPGRDSGFVPSAATVTCIAEAGSNQEVDIQWVQQ